MYGRTNAWRVPGYTEIRELGTGGAGRVVLARHDADDVLVAIKYLSDDLMSDLHFVARFRHEARLLAAMDPNPHVARFYEYVEVGAGAAIVMELINGVSLRTMLRSEGPTGPEAALTVLKGSLLGLAAAHEIGVVHRDYKPENVIITADGTSKLVDFGIAVRAGEGTSAAGTPPYMAPEQWSGASVGPTTDVYAATVVFFECLTGNRPFRAQNTAALARQHQVTPPPVEELPPPLQRLVKRGMAKHPAARPQSAQAFLEELEEVARDAYGPAWEDRGRRRLAALAGMLSSFFPVAEDAPEVDTALAETRLGRALLGKAGMKVALIAVVVAAIGGGTAAAIGSMSNTSLQADTTTVSPPAVVSFGADAPKDAPPAEPAETRSARPPSTRTPPARTPSPERSATGTPGAVPSAPPTTRPPTRRASPTASPTRRPIVRPTARKPTPTRGTPTPDDAVTATLAPDRSATGRPGQTTTARPPTTGPATTRPGTTPSAPGTPAQPSPTGDDGPKLTASPEGPSPEAVSMGVFALGLVTTGLVPVTAAVTSAAGRRRRRGRTTSRH